MSEINSSNFKKEHGDLAPDLVGVTELTSPYFFVPPSGTTEERPQDCEPGTLRFNTDIGNLEIFRGDPIGWEQIQRRDSQYLGGGTGSNTGTGVRGFLGGGNQPAITNTIEFVTISTFGDTQDFGDITAANRAYASSGSNTRGIFQNGGDPASNIINFITISSTGDAQDFGDATVSAGYRASFNNQVRSVTGGGNGGLNTVDYITIAQTGNAIDFGDLVATGEVGDCSFSSTTRGIIAGGRNTNHIEKFTIMTEGNSTDFGDLSINTVVPFGCSNAIRGLMKLRGGSYVNTVEFITIATTGNSIDFGDTSNGMKSGGGAGMASATRALFAGGYGGTGGFQDGIESFEIATTGDSVNFGDMSYTADNLTGTSNGHGGL